MADVAAAPDVLLQSSGGSPVSKRNTYLRRPLNTVPSASEIPSEAGDSTVTSGTRGDSTVTSGTRGDSTVTSGIRGVTSDTSGRNQRRFATIAT